MKIKEFPNYTQYQIGNTRLEFRKKTGEIIIGDMGEYVILIEKQDLREVIEVLEQCEQK